MEKITHHLPTIAAMIDTLNTEFVDKYGDLPWAKDVSNRIFAYSQKGKLLRGGLVVLGAEMAGHKVDERVLRLAAVMELLHSALLIHDDIMDEDSIRRGNSSMHTQYEQFAKEKGILYPEKIGQSLGICVGDIMFFLVYEVVVKLQSFETLTLLSEELITVGLGQMEDVLPEQLSTDSILKLYTYKTGRYSFSLPLLLGMSLTTSAQSHKKALMEFGQYIGPLFQITDDLLGLYGTEEKIGKPIGTDIKEGKQTLYWHLLLQKVSTQEKKQLEALYGTILTPEDITNVQHLCDTYGVVREITSLQQQLHASALRVISTLSVAENDKETLRSLVSYVSERKK